MTAERFQTDIVRVTSSQTGEPAAGAGTLCLLVIGEGLEATHPLPPSGDVLIGRSDEADIRIDHRSVSRSHAVLHLGAPLSVEDKGSSNGTRVRGARIPPGEAVTFRPGEPLEIGATLVIVQRRLEAVARHRMWTHPDFEARVSEECARATRGNARFGVLRVRCAQADKAPVAEECLGKILRPMDVLGSYGPGDFEVLLPDADPASAGEVARALRAELKLRGVDARDGLATFPEDGRDSYALLGRVAALTVEPLEHDGTMTAAGVDSPMEAVHRLVDRVAPGTISVLILGETGAGKEVLAERMHRKSPRAGQPFVQVNCAALSETLLESELFGHERGAFTGAVQTKQGLLETAHGGTVFLDEIGELPLSMQVKLLRVIEERRVLRVGAVKSRPIDVRFISATNRVLEDECAHGRFRQDLYFRLNGITLVVPPLRERRGELRAIARHLLSDACKRDGRPAMHVADDAWAVMMSHTWPGNIRELKNVLERAALLSNDGWIRAENLSLGTLAPADAAPAPAPAPAAAASSPTSLADTGEDEPGLGAAPRKLDAQRVADALNRCAGNQTEAAKLLGVSRRTLINWVEKLGLPRPRKR